MSRPLQLVVIVLVVVFVCVSWSSRAAAQRRPKHDHAPDEETARPAPPPVSSPVIDPQLLPLLQQLARPRLTDAERARLALELAKTRDLFVLQPLWKLCRDRSLMVQQAAIRGLGLLRRAEALPMLFKLAADDRVAVAHTAVLSLGHYPLPQVRRYLETLAGNAQASNVLRLAAVEALERHGTPESRAALVELAKGVGLVAVAAARAAKAPPCAGCQEPRASLLLRTLLSAGEPRRRAAAVQALAKEAWRDNQSKKNLLPVLLFAADDDATPVRRNAIHYLGYYPGPQAEARLIEALVTGRNTDERKLGLKGLHQRRGAAVRRALTHVVTTGVHDLRLAALDELALHEETEVQSFLVQVRDRSNDPRLRLKAHEILARRGTAGPAHGEEASGVAAAPTPPVKPGEPAVGPESAPSHERREPAAGPEDAPPREPRVVVSDREESAPPRLEKETTVAQPEKPRGPDRSGFIPLLLVSGAAGAGGLYSIAAGAEGDHAWIAGLSGAVLGGGTAALLNLKGEVPLRNAGTFLTVTGWGVTAGLQGGVAAGLGHELAWPVLAADVLGVGASFLAMRQPWRGGDFAFVNLTAAQGSIAGLGLGAVLFPHGSDTVGERVGHGLAEGLLPAAALAAASLSTRRVKLSRRDAGLLAFGGVAGGAIGGLMVPGIALDPPGGQIAGGVALGEALGYGGAALLSQYSELTAPQQGWLWTSTSALSLAGGGLGMLVDDLRGRPSFALASGGAGLGVALGALGHRALSLRTRDLPLTFLGAGVGAWSGAWLPVMIHDGSEGVDGTGRAGGMLLTGLTGMLAGNVASRLTDVRPRTVGIAAISTAAATALGGGTGLMLGRSPDAGGVGVMDGLTFSGLAAGLALAPRMRFSQSDIGLTALTAGLGGWAMGWVPALRRDDDEDVSASETAGGVTAGVGLGVLAGMAAAQWSDLDGRDVAELGAWSVGGYSFGAGLGMLVDRGRRVTTGLMEGGGAVGLAAGSLLASRMTYSRRDALLMTQLGLGGALQGAFLPDVWHAGGAARVGGVLAGGSLGLLAGAVLAQPTEVHPGDVGEMSLALAAGDSLGAGIGLLADMSQSNTIRLMEGVGLATWVAGSLRAPYTRHSGRDALLMTQLGLGGALQGALLPAVWRGEGGDIEGGIRAGGAMALGSSGLILGSLLAQRTEVHPKDVGEMSLALATGDLLGGGIGLLADLSHSNTIRLMEGVGLATWVAGSLRAPHTRHSGRDALLMAQLGLGGALQGALLPAVWRDEGQEIEGGIRAGGAMALGSSGLILGSLLAQRTEVHPGDVGEMSLALATGDLLGGGIGLLADLSHSNTIRLMEGVGLAAWVAGSLRAPYTRHSGRDALLMAQLGLGGALQGALLPTAWRDEGWGIPGSMRAGGAMALGSAGLILGSLLAQRTEVHPKDVGEMSLALATGDLLGGGIGLLADLSHSNTIRLMEGVGLATWVAGSLRAPYTRHSGRDILLMSQLGLGGALQGALLPAVWRDEGWGIPGSMRAGGAMALGSAGLILGSLVGQRSEVRPRDVGEMSLALATGDLLGAGIGMLADLSHSNTVRLMEGVGLATWVAGSLRAPHTDHSGRDVLLMSQLGLGGALQGALLPAVWRDEGWGIPGAMRAGGAMALGSAGLILGSLVGQHSEVHPGDVGEMSLALATGDLLGAGVGMLADLSHSNTVRLMEGVGLATWVAGSLRAPHTRHSGRDVFLTAQLAAGGALQGALLPDLWRSEDADVSASSRLGGSMVGASLGMVAGSLLAQRSEMAPGDVGEMALALATGDALGAGIGLAADMSEANTLRVMQAVGTATWIAGGLRAPGTRYTGRDRVLMAALGGYGAFLGAWTPVWKTGDLGEVSAAQVCGGALAGSAAGLIAGSIVAPRIEAKGDASSSFELGLASAGWSLFGAGLGLVIPTEDDRLPIGLMQGFGLAGTVGSSFLVDRTRYSNPDRVLTSLTVGFGAWQGVGTSLMFEASDRQIAGAVMATTGLGFLAGATVSQLVDLSQAEVWTLFSGSVWGATAGVLGANVARDLGSDLSTGQIVGITTLASDVGLGLGALALSPVLRWSAKRVGYINLFGLGGVALGAAIGGPIESKIGTQLGVVAGSVTGLATGVVLTGLLKLGTPGSETAAAPLIDPSGALSASKQEKERSTMGSRKRGRRLTDPRGNRTPLIADWTPAVIMEPDVDASTGETRKGNVKMLFGVRGVLH